jgi:hypothetical protein
VGKDDTNLFLLLIALRGIGFGDSVFLPGSMRTEVIDYYQFYIGRQSAVACGGAEVGLMLAGLYKG